MARYVKPLSDAEIKKAKPKEKDYKLFDGGGLFLLIKKNGKKFWKIKFRINGKENTKSLGEYPTLSLYNARQKHLQLKEDLQNGINPNDKSFENKSLTKIITYEVLVKEFLEFKVQELSYDYFKKVKRRFEIYIFPIIGKMNVDEIEKSDIINLIKNIQQTKTSSTKQTNKAETMKIVYNLLNQSFTWGIHNDLTSNSVMGKIDKKSLIVKSEVEHFKAVVDKNEIRELYKIVNSYFGSEQVKYALVFLMLSTLRSINVRFLRWEQVDFKKKIIFYDAKDMKTKEDFRLPLTDVMVDILSKMREFTDSGKYVFCAMTTTTKPLSENTLGYALKRMDILNHTPHGFRSSFSTLAYEHQKEHGFSSEVIETQLSHSVGGRVKVAYLRSDFLEDRRELLEWWYKFLTRMD